MCLQRPAVIINAIEHNRGYRKDHARRGKFAFRQDMMDQAAMHAAVAVLERVSVDKAKGGRRRLQDGIEPGVAHAVIGVQQAGAQAVKILWPGADEFWQGLTEMIAPAEEDAVRPQAREDKPGIFD